MMELETIWIEEGNGEGFHLNRDLTDCFFGVLEEIGYRWTNGDMDRQEKYETIGKYLCRSFPPPNLRRPGDG